MSLTLAANLHLRIRPCWQTLHLALNEKRHCYVSRAKDEKGIKEENIFKELGIDFDILTQDIKIIEKENKELIDIEEEREEKITSLKFNLEKKYPKAYYFIQYRKKKFERYYYMFSTLYILFKISIEVLFSLAVLFNWQY